MHVITNVILTTIAAAILLCVTGCSESSVAPASKRISKFKANFDVIESAVSSPDSTSESIAKGALQFIHRDHFACLQISIADLKKSPELAQVPWQDLESSIQEFLLPPDSQNLATALYLMFDSQLFKFEDPQQCMVFVAEFADEIEIPADNSDEVGEEEPIKQKLGDRYLAYGPKEAVAKLRGETAKASPIVNNINADSSISGAVSVRPIRPSLKGIFALFAMQPQLQEYSSLPDDIQQVVLDVNVDSKQQFLSIDLEITNDDLRRKIVQSINQATANPVDFDAVPEGLANMPESINSTDTPQVMMEMASEVVSEALISVEESGQNLQISLQRPEKFSEFVASMVKDYSFQVQFAQRMENLEQVAKALEQYHEKNGTLPPLGRVEPGNKLPAQLNWRTGILKFLGYEELYNKFDFAKPWDDEANLAAAKDIPKVFQLENTEKYSIAMVKGPERLYAELSDRPSVEKVSDRKIWTAIAVEIPNSNDKNWVETELKFSPTEIDSVGFESETGVATVTASFDVRILKKSTGKLADLFTVKGGERFSRSDFIKLGQ